VRLEQAGQRDRLLVAVVHAVEHQVLHEHLAPAALVPAQAAVEHLSERVPPVHRHQLGAQRLVGGVHRQRQPHGWALARHALDARKPPDRGDSRIRRRDADVGQPLAGGEHRVQVHERLAHAHEDGVVDRLPAAEVERLVHDLGGREVAPEAHPPGGAERAGQRTARLARQAERAAPVAVAHQHGLNRPTVAGLEQRLLRAVAGERLADRAQRAEGDLARQRVAQVARKIGHLPVGRCPSRGPLPHLPGAEAGLAAGAQPLPQQHEIHA
jgi:hypothetical protein